MTETTKIVIVGNGFGGTYALKNLHRIFHNNPKIEITIIGEKNYFLFTPLLHEVATGGINGGNIIEPIRKIIGHNDGKFYLGKVEKINLGSHTVEVGDKVIPYDHLILAPGSETNFYGMPGAEKHSFTLKSIDNAIKLKNHCLIQMERAANIEDREERKKILRFVIVGAGPTGVELAGELQEFVTETFSRYYKREIIEDISVVIMERGPELMSMFGPKMRRKSEATLRKKGVHVMLNTQVKEVNAVGITISDGTMLYSETVIWVAGVKPKELNFDLPITKSKDGKLLVNKYLQLENHEEVFAIGDVASFIQNDAPVPALAQAAEKEAKAVAKNIELLINKKKPVKFVYHHSGNMLSIGQWMAIGEIFGFTFSGRITWWVWRTVYLSKLISFRKKVRVAIDWTMNIFSPRDISQF